MIKQAGKYPVREVVLHCAAIKTGQFKGMTPLRVFSTINRWHTERGFKNGFGYHGFVMPDGSLHAGRPLDMIGAHVLGHNRGTFGLLLIESFEIDRLGQFSDWFTQAQAHAVRGWLRDLGSIEKVTGHNDYAAKLCPGFHVNSSDWLS